MGLATVLIQNVMKAYSTFPVYKNLVDCHLASLLGPLLVMKESLPVTKEGPYKPDQISRELPIEADI